MKIKAIMVVSMMLALVACKPSVPDSPDPSTYGQTIQPFHQIPSEDQEGGGKPRSMD
ncbi:MULTISPECIES: hypothetical protein [Nitrosomonas]|uniref:Lipoprotein n=1 Tax=Nitrosomonas halophila TaxID=44576 RepID=A0A1H3IEU6_9PROT|nr:hypothetical protein [Nitrosomonas halophila]SDY25608.1 hypothetical protein SAMN05421881_10261 [Nitrosomonas halophila]